MTQEEKLEEAKRLYETANADQKYVLERLFPELAESEDEVIIERIKKAVESYWSDEPLDEILAWLEKQKTTTSNKDIEKIRNAAIYACKYMVDNFENSTKQYEDAITWLEKQGKNNMGISEATKQRLEDNLHKALEKETPESWNKFLDGGEQKPAWSVEDEKKINNILNVLIDYKELESEYYWLKFLKDRVQPQPQQQWSEEDIMRIDNLIAIIENRGYPDYVEYLEKLKERYT